MIDKRTLNNEIVLMRKVVKQAKVHIINKLSREIKNLRKKEGPEELKSKCNRKADRKKDEIFAIKKLNIDDVSKFALKNLEDPVKKIGDQGVNLELRAYFRFAATKVLSARVTAFREQYPDWKDYIHDLLDELGGRRKNSNQPSKVAKVAKHTPVANNPKERNDSKEEKSLMSKREHEDGQIKESQNKINGKLGITGSPTAVKKSKFLSSQWSVEEIEPVAVRANHVALHQKDRNNRVKCDKSRQDTPIVHRTPKTDHRFSSSKERFGIAEVKRFHELCDSQESVSRERSSNLETDEGNSDDDEDDDNGETDDVKAVDPFFVKADGKTEYVTKMVVEEGDEGDEKDHPLSRGGGKQLKGGQQQWKGSGWGGREGGKDSRGGGRGFRGGGRGRGSYGEQGQLRRGRGGHGRGGGNPWSEQSRGGHDQGSRFAGRSDSVRGNEKFSRKNQPAESGGAHLHPSWEAKRKLKEQSISNIAFQGKKIKFDDDE